MKTEFDTQRPTMSAFGKYGDSIRFSDFNELYHISHTIVSKLNLNPVDRQNEHREVYSVLHWLLHECSSNRITFPIVLTKDVVKQAPDFVLKLADEREIGIEITEATTKERMEGLKAFATKAPESSISELAGSANSGLVGTAIELAEDYATREWAKILSERILDKNHKALNYQYSNSIELVVYSNTGYDFENVGKAIAELRKLLPSKTPFSRISILIGRDFLVGDIFGKTYQHENFAHFNELENAIDFLEQIYIFLTDAGPLREWKWVWISLYEALYSLIVCSICGSDYDRVMNPIQCSNSTCAKIILPGELRDSGLKCPFCGTDLKSVFKEQLITFDEALRRAKDKSWMLQNIFSKELTLSDEEERTLKYIAHIANGLLNFTPKTWIIKVPARDKIVLSSLDILERLVSGSHNIFLDDIDRMRVGSAVEKIRSVLANPFASDYVPPISKD